jgi:hypothetical protein
MTQKKLDDIYKEIQECLSRKAKHGNKNDDKKDEERKTVKYMFLNLIPANEEIRNSIIEVASQGEE